MFFLIINYLALVELNMGTCSLVIEIFVHIFWLG